MRIMPTGQAIISLSCPTSHSSVIFVDTYNILKKCTVSLLLSNGNTKKCDACCYASILCSIMVQPNLFVGCKTDRVIATNDREDYVVISTVINLADTIYLGSIKDLTWNDYSNTLSEESSHLQLRP